MIDNYPTRKQQNGYFIPRTDWVAYCIPDFLSEDQYKQYISEGFLVMKHFFDPEHIEEVRQAHATGFITNDPTIPAIRSVTGIHDQEPFYSLCRDRGLLDIARNVLGSGVYLHQSRINYKSGISSNGWYWHSDFETWHAQDGMPSMRCFSAMIPLLENNVCNGSLMVIPGSHHRFYACKQEPSRSAEENFADQKEGIPDVEALKEFFRPVNDRPYLVLCEPGDVVLFDCNIIHGSTQNMTPQARTNLFFVYNSIYNKLVAPFSANAPRPEEMGARLNTDRL